MKKTVIWGAAGHAKVLLSVLKRGGFAPCAFIDRRMPGILPVPGLPVFASAEDMLSADTGAGYFAIAIGGALGKDRCEIHDRLVAAGLKPAGPLVHERGFAEETAVLGEGAQVLTMATVGADARIGKQTIINTNSSVDHESVIGQGCHIMPGATVAGLVEIADFCTVGFGAVVHARVKIGEGAAVEAGAHVTRDVPPGAAVKGHW
jgi:sugar O-acyltransferase (sialic acid O-acetyltransferase NeuD family)